MNFRFRMGLLRLLVLVCIYNSCCAFPRIPVENNDVTLKKQVPVYLEDDALVFGGGNDSIYDDEDDDDDDEEDQVKESSSSSDGERDSSSVSVGSGGSGASDSEGASYGKDGERDDSTSGSQSQQTLLVGEQGGSVAGVQTQQGSTDYSQASLSQTQPGVEGKPLVSGQDQQGLSGASAGSVDAQLDSQTQPGAEGQALVSGQDQQGLSGASAGSVDAQLDSQTQPGAEGQGVVSGQDQQGLSGASAGSLDAQLDSQTQPGAEGQGVVSGQDQQGLSGASAGSVDAQLDSQTQPGAEGQGVVSGQDQQGLSGASAGSVDAQLDSQTKPGAEGQGVVSGQDQQGLIGASAGSLDAQLDSQIQPGAEEQAGVSGQDQQGLSGAPAGSVDAQLFSQGEVGVDGESLVSDQQELTLTSAASPDSGSQTHHESSVKGDSKVGESLQEGNKYSELEVLSEVQNLAENEILDAATPLQEGEVLAQEGQLPSTLSDSQVLTPVKADGSETLDIATLLEPVEATTEVISEVGEVIILPGDESVKPEGEEPSLSAATEVAEVSVGEYTTFSSAVLEDIILNEESGTQKPEGLDAADQEVATEEPLQEPSLVEEERAQEQTLLEELTTELSSANTEAPLDLRSAESYFATGIDSLLSAASQNFDPSAIPTMRTNTAGDLKVKGLSQLERQGQPSVLAAKDRTLKILSDVLVGPLTVEKAGDGVLPAETLLEFSYKGRLALQLDNTGPTPLVRLEAFDLETVLDDSVVATPDGQSSLSEVVDAVRGLQIGSFYVNGLESELQTEPIKNEFVSNPDYLPSSKSTYNYVVS